MRTSARHRTRPDDEFTPQSLSRKQVLDALRKGRPLGGADLRGTDLSGISFDGVDMEGTKLADADLSGCSFKGTNLQGASMWAAKLRNVSFDEANLDLADLDCADIDACTFLGARIRKTIFPNQRECIDMIEESVRTGSPVSVPSDLSDLLD